MNHIEYWLNGRKVTLDGNWEAIEGGPERLIDEDDNLISGTDWNAIGFAVVEFLSPAQNETLRSGLADLICDSIRDAGILSIPSARLEHYHRFADTEEKHAAVVRVLQRGFDIDRLAVHAETIADRISAVCRVPLVVGHKNNTRIFSIRMVRPLSRDNNPPHRDVWLDRLRNAVNIYFPICGSNELSSLPVIPGSHLWPEDRLCRTSQGARFGDSSYTVPSVVATKEPFVMTRPNPGPNEVLVFSPYMVHGGAVNFNEDVTRVSLEMRFQRKVV